MQTHPNEVFRRQRGHIETLQGQVKNLQATNLSLLFKVVFGAHGEHPAIWAGVAARLAYKRKPTALAYRVRKEQA